MGDWSGSTFSFGMLVSIGFILSFLSCKCALSAKAKFFSRVLPIAGFSGKLRLMVSFIGVTLLFALVFKYVPDTRIQWKDGRVGAVATSLRPGGYRAIIIALNPFDDV